MIRFTGKPPFLPTGIKQGRLPEQTALGNPITKRGISRFFPKNTLAVILLYIIYTYVREVKEFVVWGTMETRG